MNPSKPSDWYAKPGDERLTPEQAAKLPPLGLIVAQDHLNDVRERPDNFLVYFGSTRPLFDRLKSHNADDFAYVNDRLQCVNGITSMHRKMSDKWTQAKAEYAHLQNLIDTEESSKPKLVLQPIQDYWWQQFPGSGEFTADKLMGSYFDCKNHLYTKRDKLIEGGLDIRPLIHRAELRETHDMQVHKESYLSTHTVSKKDEHDARTRQLLDNFRFGK